MYWALGREVKWNTNILLLFCRMYLLVLQIHICSTLRYWLITRINLLFGDGVGCWWYVVICGVFVIAECVYLRLFHLVTNHTHHKHHTAQTLYMHHKQHMLVWPCLSRLLSPLLCLLLLVVRVAGVFGVAKFIIRKKR